ncbi:MAG: hypothetical protein ACLFRU_01285 [Paracoccaceae bacterium]
MDPDLALVIGLVVAVFAIPGIVSALSDGRPPRAAAFSVMVAGGLVAWALIAKPGGYRLDEVPEAVIAVLGRLLN